MEQDALFSFFQLEIAIRKSQLSIYLRTWWRLDTQPEFSFTSQESAQQNERPIWGGQNKARKNAKENLPNPFIQRFLRVSS